MDHHVKEYFRQFSDETPRGNFHHVLSLHDAPDIQWEDVKAKIADLPRGWYELAEMKAQDRIDMLRDYWLSQLSYQCHLMEQVDSFFSKLDDIGIFLIQAKFDDPYKAELVYSLKDNSGFFRGAAPATDKQIVELQKAFPESIFPEDYTAFMRMHNGFFKANDTGIIPVGQVPDKYRVFAEQFLGDDFLMTTSGEIVNPKSLIPFYESFGMPFYQCFWNEWYPANEMGNVYYSGITKTISCVKSKDPNCDAMAFNTFTDWLMFYLETIA